MLLSLNRSNWYTTSGISNPVDSTGGFWVAAVAPAGRPSWSVFVYICTWRGDWDYLLQIFPTFFSLFLSHPTTLLTHHHRKCGLAFIFTSWKWNFGASKTKNDGVALYETPEGCLNEPVAVRGTVHCFTGCEYCRICCGWYLNVNDLRLCLHHVPYWSVSSRSSKRKSCSHARPLTIKLSASIVRYRKLIKTTSLNTKIWYRLLSP